MKNTTMFKRIFVIISIITLFAFVPAMAASPYYHDTGIEYGDSNDHIKIVDNVVYEFCDRGEYEKSPEYSVIEFGATKEIRKKMTEIVIREEIDGIPVREIYGEPDKDCVNPTAIYPNVSKITIPDSIVRIGRMSFSGLINIKKIDLPAGLKELGSKAFGRLEKLEEVSIPEGIERIKAETFKGCIALKKVTFKGNVRRIDESAFDGCKSLSNINSGNKLEYIGYRAFYNCANLKSFYFSKTLKTIEAWAFNGSGLTSVSIPSGAKLSKYWSTEDSDCIYGSQFKNCKSLKKVAFGNTKNAVTIPLDCFEGCTALKSVALPESAKKISIYPGAFRQSGLTKVKLPSGTVFVKSSFTNEAEEACYGSQFKDCKKLNSVVFEDTKKSVVIPNDCFAGCTALKSVALPKSAKGITLFPRAFYNCTSLKTVENSGRISGIRASAFKNCKSLESIKFSSKIKYIEKMAFKGCSKLKSVTFKDTKSVPVNTYAKNSIRTSFDKGTFAGTPNSMKFFVKNATVAKKLRTALKGSGVRNARIYTISGNRLVYTGVK